MDAASPVELALTQVRAERARLLAALIRLGGDFQAAEDLLQEALLCAIERWPRDGVPNNPAAWVLRVAQRRGLDLRRRERGEALESHAERAALPQDEPMDDERIPDERLALVFTCCHPALAPGSRSALTLQAVAGLTATEIARGLLLREATVAQRLVRAKRKIREAGIALRVPSPAVWPVRLGGVLEVLYLLFNEGHTATAGVSLQRVDLAEEALRLAALVAELLPAEPEALGLAALLLATHARSTARSGPTGEFITLEHQDRGLWDADRLRRADDLLTQAQELRCAGPYQLQAAIACLHGAAPSWSSTDWTQISLLYGKLHELQPSPVIRLSGILAEAMVRGPRWALAELGGIERDGSLEAYQPYHAARADLHRRAGAPAEAAAAYGRALELTHNAAQRRFLEQRLMEVST